VRTRLINIGNSKGVRLPKAIIEQAGLTTELEMEVSADAVVIRSARQTRQGWASAAAACREAGEDQLGNWGATIGDFDNRARFTSLEETRSRIGRQRP
jgi:antitoxin MazE